MQRLRVHRLLSLMLLGMALIGCADDGPAPAGDATDQPGGQTGVAEPGAEDAHVAQAQSAPETSGPGRTVDDETAQVLFSMGIMPLREAHPSEGFLLATLDGSQGRLADHLGKIVFLNFWATWCPPCREEMPSMQTLYDELRSDGLEIVAVNVMEPRETVAPFIEEFGYTYPVLLDIEGRVMSRYAVRAYPTTYVIDRDGYVIGARPGGHDWAQPAVIEGFRTLLEM